MISLGRVIGMGRVIGLGRVRCGGWVGGTEFTVLRDSKSDITYKFSNLFR